MRNSKFRSVIRNGYELFLVMEIPFDKQQEYLATEEATEENDHQTEDVPQQLDLNFESNEDLPF